LVALFSKSFSSTVVILGSLLLGLVLPQVGLLWSSFTLVILATMMFLVSLTIEPSKIAPAVKSHKIVVFATFTIFVVPSLLGLFALPLFSSIEYAAIALAMCAPSAVSSIFWCDMFRGNAALALVLSVVANLLSIVVMPTVMLLAVGMFIPIDVVSIVRNLLFLIVLPLFAGQLLRKIFPQKIKMVTARNGTAQLVLLVFLLWGAVSPGAGYATANLGLFALFNVFIFCILGLTFLITYVLGRRFGHSQAIALSLVSTHKNATLAIVVGGLLFGPIALPPLIANLVAQNILLIPARVAVDRVNKNEPVVCNVP